MTNDARLDIGGRILETHIIAHGTNEDAQPIPHTCEHCKFWEKTDKFDGIHGECLKIDGYGVNDFVYAPWASTIYYRQDFGCIFWEPKECSG